ncbi:response regulator transcription factor [Leucobacter allii]|uniref:response regulator n=1 Tax=Leucobacter allii TaxID=2932247 RepID=UPI001FD495FA|nr:response regulator transcription factor [Leucobacter allii]UOR02178.1 response regulator transcription factor [Leucobacter allii]
MIELVIVDDQELVRAGLRLLVQRDGDIAVVGEAENGADGVELVRRVRPAVALMDLSMPVQGGVEATAAIVSDPSLASTRVLVLTTFDTDAEVFAAISAGAAGYLLKDVSPEGLRAAVRAVARGDGCLDPAVTARVMRAAGSPALRALPAELTERESDVLALVGRGLSNEEIARELFLSPATARTYVSRLLGKLGARDRAALVILAYESGTVRPGGGAEGA